MKDVKQFQQMYRDGQVNRREFLAAMGALGVSATSAGQPPEFGQRARGDTQEGRDRALREQHPRAGRPDGPDRLHIGIDYARGRVTYNGLIQIRDNMVLAPRAGRRVVRQQ